MEFKKLSKFHFDSDEKKLSGRIRVRSVWDDPVMTNDLSQYHSIDAEAELMRLFAQEIDRQMNLTTFITQQPLSMLYMDYIYPIFEPEDLTFQTPPKFNFAN